MQMEAIENNKKEGASIEEEWAVPRRWDVKL